MPAKRIPITKEFPINGYRTLQELCKFLTKLDKKYPDSVILDIYDQQENGSYRIYLCLKYEREETSEEELSRYLKQGADIKRVRQILDEMDND